MSYYEDGSVDQFRLPIAYAFGQATVETLLTKDFEAWAAARRATCGHPSPVQGCRVCQGTIKVNDAVLQGADGVRVFPER